MDAIYGKSSYVSSSFRPSTGRLPRNVNITELRVICAFSGLALQVPEQQTCGTRERQSSHLVGKEDFTLTSPISWGRKRIPTSHIPIPSYALDLLGTVSSIRTLPYGRAYCDRRSLAALCTYLKDCDRERHTPRRPSLLQIATSAVWWSRSQGGGLANRPCSGQDSSLVWLRR